MGIGFSKTVTFEKITQAQNYVRQYRKKLTDYILALNALQPQINTLYRQNIVQLDSQTLTDCQIYLRNFDDSFLKVFELYSTGNRSGFVHSHLANCFKSLENAIASLLAYAHKNKNYGLKTALVPLQNTFTLIDRDFSTNREKMLDVKN